MITIENITLQRGALRLLDNASATIHPGHKVAVIGANGCGKSSFFALLLGQLQLDAGELFIPKNWRIAHMAQEVEYADRTAIDHVLDGDQVLRQTQADIAQIEQEHDSEDSHKKLANLHAKLEDIHGYDATTRAEQLLHGLGFSQQQIQHKVSDFSGGWRIRLNLAQALMCPSDLLLLDEPSNHLDLDATLWLEQWLRAYQGTLILISHDRDFIDNVADEIFHFEFKKINSYKGNYSAFEKQRAEQLAQQQASYEKQQSRIAEINSFVTRFKAKASKAKQAQSRVKELERMEKIAPAHVDSPFHFEFKAAEKISSPLINLQQAQLGYGEKIILEKVDLNLQPGSRIGLLGPNGAGKSTLIKSLVGDIPVLAGERICGGNLAIGYFAQHQLEALDLSASAATHIQRLSAKATEQEIRNFLGGFDFHGDKVLEPIAPFSGGEKARLALALIVWQKPNLLLMDEPTNHLDLEMRHALTVALQSFVGALIVISHDRHLLRNTVDEYYKVAHGSVEPFAGTLDDYHVWLKQYNQQKPTDKQSSSSSNKQDKKTLRQQAAELRKQKQPVMNKIKKLEDELKKAQNQVQEIEEALADNTLYDVSNKEKLKSLLQQQAEIHQSIALTEEAWMVALQELENLESTM